MNPDLNAPLSPSEFQALRDVSKGMMQPIIPDAHKKRLLQAGFIKEALGGLMVTDAGQMRIAVGK